MTQHNLPPQHQEVAQKATERIKQSIARVIFKATEGLEPTILNVLESGTIERASDANL